ncbi:hypothetical protein TrVFT333_002395 [Trichoderma virens FT-333]|nr:hypothetical protein TrVFT333_002395 [Trichoderma virens FT-333]
MPAPISDWIAKAQKAAEEGDAADVENALTMLGLVYHLGSLASLDATINENTGDTILHVAAANGRLAVIKKITTHVWSRCPDWPKRVQRYSFATKRNKAGNTALHLAVRQPDIDIVRAVYRFAQNDFLPGDDRYGHTPVEDLTDRIDDEDFGPALVLLMAKNCEGRDAAAEARWMGQEANAKWCEDVIERLDPEHKHQSEAEVNRLGDFVAGLYSLE